jgi:hypothetical protein
MRPLVAATAWLALTACGEPSGPRERPSGTGVVVGRVTNMSAEPVLGAHGSVVIPEGDVLSTQSNGQGEFFVSIFLGFATADNVAFFIDVTPPVGSGLAPPRVQGLTIDLCDEGQVTDTVRVEIPPSRQP